MSFQSRRLWAITLVWVLSLSNLIPVLLPAGTVYAAAVNLALGKAYKSSSAYNSSPAWGTTTAFDGNYNTAWRNASTEDGKATPSTPIWLKMDLGSQTTFNQIKLREPDNIGGVDYGNRILQFALQYSNDSTNWTSNPDNTTWTTIYSSPATNDFIGSAGSRMFNFADVTARYVRLAITQKVVVSPVMPGAISEFEVYNVPPQPTGISLNKTSATIVQGASEQLTAIVAPAGADQSVNWTSDDTSIVAVANGLVTGVNTGTTTIHATSVASAVYRAGTQVTVTADGGGISSTKDITSFGFNGTNPATVGQIDQSTGLIMLTVPQKTAVNSIAVTFTTTGSSVYANGVLQTSGVTTNDFSMPVAYAVYAADNSTKQYMAYINPIGTTDIALGKKVTASTSYESSINGLLKVTDGNPATYWRHLSTDTLPMNVMVDLGSVHGMNRVVIKEFLRGGKYRILGYELLASPDGAAWTSLSTGDSIGENLTVDLDNNISARYVKILITDKDPTDFASIADVEVYNLPVPVTGIQIPSVPTLNIGGIGWLEAAAAPLNADQGVIWSTADSSITKVDQNGVIVGVSAGTTKVRAISQANPAQYAEKDVTVLPQISQSKDILDFRFSNFAPNAIGIINGKNILVTVPYKAARTNLAATFKSSGSKVYVTNVEQISGGTVNDFTGPVTYTVVAADHSTKTYTVSVSEALSDEKAMTSFGLSGINGTVNINGSNIVVTVPENTDLSKLIAVFTTTGQKVLVGGIEQTSGTIMNDFTRTVVYQVVALDGSVKNYNVDVWPNASTVGIQVSNQIVGKSPSIVGFSMMNTQPGDNLLSWLKYSKANGVRFWVAPSRFIGDANVDPGNGIASVNDFDVKKNALRADPTGSGLINWITVEAQMEYLNDSGENYAVKDAYTRFKQNNIDVLTEMHGSKFDLDWSTSWRTWVKVYAAVFYLAKNFDAVKYQTPNEPELISPAVTNETYVRGVQIYSDAIRSAIEDVNRLYGKNLTPVVNGPVLASSGTSELAKAIIQNNRTDYHGNPVSYDILNEWDKHRYSSDAPSYGYEIDSMNSLMVNYSPTHEALPITYSEFNYSTNASWKTQSYTSDDPMVFRTEGTVWSNMMEHGAFGLYQFKFATPNSFNGNLVSYIFEREKDPAKNLLFNKTVIASSGQSTAAKTADGNSTDSSAWSVNNSTGADQTLVYDLGGNYTIKQLVLYTGTRGGADALKSFQLQYWDPANGGTWKNLPGGSQTSNTSDMYTYAIPNDSWVTTNQIRFYSNFTGTIKVREIYVSAEDYKLDIGGPMKSAEVTRMFAEGFKDERNLYQTTVTAKDTKFKAFTSLDPVTNQYYMWLPQTSDLVNYKLNLDFSQLDVNPGSTVMVREVSANHFGEVVQEVQVPSDKKLTLYEPKSSVWLITIPKAALQKKEILPVSDALVELGTAKDNNFGSADTLAVKRVSNFQGNSSASYLKFAPVITDISKVNNVILSVYGQKASAPDPYSIHVYALKNSGWTEDAITGSTAPNLNANAAFIEGIGSTAEPVGLMTFSGTAGYSSVDVTDYVKNHANEEITFVLIREKRNTFQSDDTDSIVMSSKENSAVGQRPKLEIWSIIKNSSITPVTATFDKDENKTADLNVTVTLNGNTLRAIKNGSTALTSSDYTVTGNVYTIKKKYLVRLPLGTTPLTFTFSAGADQTLTVNVAQQHDHRDQKQQHGVDD